MEDEMVEIRDEPRGPRVCWAVWAVREMGHAEFH